MLLEQLGRHFENTSKKDIAESFFKKAQDVGEQTRVVHDSIFQHQLLSADLQFQRNKPE